MRELLSKMIGQRVDVYCGGASSLRGEVIGLDGGVVRLKDDNEQICYVAVDKVIVVWEARDADEHRAGFVSKVQKS